MALKTQFLRSCLENCLIAASDLEHLNRVTDDPNTVNALQAARRLLDQCVAHCEFAYKLV